MGFEKTKNYLGNFSAGFKRFPVASAQSIFIAIASLIILLFQSPTPTPLLGSFYTWLVIYPIAATIIAYITTLVQESRKSTNKSPQILASTAWFVISWALALCDYTDYYDIKAINRIIKTLYISLFTIALTLPFFKQKNDNAFWIFWCKEISRLIPKAIIIAFVTCMALGVVIRIFTTSIDSKDIAAFSLSVFLPLPFLIIFAKTPTIDKCLEETPAFDKQSLKLFRFIYFPIFTIAAAVIYINIVKSIIQWSIPSQVIIDTSILTLGLVLFLETELYPASINPEPTFEKKFLKAIPYASLPIVIIISVHLFLRISDYGITEFRLYGVSFIIYFCIHFAINHFSKTVALSKHEYAILLAILIIFFNSPINATNITRSAWLNNIKETLVEEGYSEFPLSKEDSKKFFADLWKKDEHKASILASQVKELHSRPDKKLYQYFPENANLNRIIKKTPPITLTIENNNVHTAPQGTSHFIFIDHVFNKGDFETQNDTLFIPIPLNKFVEDDSSAFYNKEYRFCIPKQNWSSKNIKVLETEGAKFEVEYINFSQKESKNHQPQRTLRLRGILFME